MATHNDLITLNYVLDPAPIAATNFGLTLILCEDIAFTGGDTYRTYASYKAAQADADLSAAALEAVRVAFSQIRKPSSVLVGDVKAAGEDLGALTLTFNDDPATIVRSTGSFIADGVLPGDTLTPAGTVSNNTTFTVTSVDSATQVTVSPAPTDEVGVAASSLTWVQSYGGALQTVIDDGAAFFGITMESRAAADQLDVSADVETMNRVMVAQTSDATAITSGWPAAIAAIEGRENTAVIYHDDDTQWADVAWLSGRISHNFDQTSPGAEGALREVDAATVNDTEKSNAITNNINLPLEFGPEDCYVSPGVNANGRPFDHIWSVYWFIDRTNAKLQALKLNYDARGQKIPMDASGQQLIKNTIQEQVDLAVTYGHFKEDQVVFDFPNPIPSGDIDARDLAATVYITNETGASSFTITFNFSRTDVVPVAEEEA